MRQRKILAHFPVTDAYTRPLANILKKGTDILNSLIGQKLIDGKIQSLYSNSELVDKINSTYLKFDKWIRVVTTDEMTKVYQIEELDKELYSDLKDGFEFPIDPIKNHYTDFDKYLNKKLLNWKELVRKDATTMSFGLKLFFENNLTFIIHNEDYPADRNEFIFDNEIPEHLIEI